MMLLVCYHAKSYASLVASFASVNEACPLIAAVPVYKNGYSHLPVKTISFTGSDQCTSHSIIEMVGVGIILKKVYNCLGPSGLI